MARPTKYKPSYIEEVDKYIESTGREQTKLPTKEGFALSIGVDDDTLDNWAKKNKKFFGALKRLMMYQKEQLTNDGIYGGKEVNAIIIKLLLQSNHGMKDRIDQTTKDKALPSPIYGSQSTK